MEKKRKIIGPVIFLVLVAGLVLTLGTYAYWQVTEKQTNRNIVGTACLNITFTNELNDINLTNMWPTSDEDGEQLTPYSFTVTNTCDTAINYVIALESLADEESQNPSYISDDYVVVKVDNLNERPFSSYETITSDTTAQYTIRNTRQITTHTLGAHESNDHELRLWLKYDTPLSEMNKFFWSKIRITAGQNIGGEVAEGCYSVNTQGVLTKYNPDCGTDVVIPDEVEGVQVKAIGSNAFYTNPYADGYTVYMDQYTSDDVDFSINMSNRLAMLMAEVGDENDIDLLSNEDLWVVVNNEVDGLDDAIEVAKTMEPVSFMIAQIEANNYELDDACDYGTSGCNNGIISFLFHVVEDNGVYSAELIGENIDGSIAPMLFGSEDDIFFPTSVDFSEAEHLEEIKANAFKDYNTASSLELPDTITKIGDYAFYRYSGSTLDLPDSLEEAGKYSFAYYHGSALELPSTLKIVDEDAFASYSGNELVLPNSIEVIGSDAFTSYDGANLTLPTSLKVLGSGAFYDYVGTGNSLTIPNGVTDIGYGAFKKFNGTAITLPNALVNLGANAFYSYVGTGVNLTLPNTITTIGGGAFYTFNGSSITLPTSLTTLKDYAFYSFVGENASLTLPNTLTSIGEYAFYNYKGTGSTLTIPSGLTTIAAGAFHEYNGSSLVLNDAITNIKAQAFYKYNGAAISIPSHIVEVGESGFGQYRGLGSTLVLPDTLTTLGERSFQWFKGDSLTLNTTLTSIPDYAFAAYVGTGEDLEIPSNITSIGIAAFWQWKGNNLILHEGLQTIGASAFQECKGTTNALYIPHTVTSIGHYAFKEFLQDVYVYSQDLFNSSTDWLPHQAIYKI